jgi:hypothetical protein
LIGDVFLGGVADDARYRYLPLLGDVLKRASAQMRAWRAAALPIAAPVRLSSWLCGYRSPRKSLHHFTS